MALDQQSESRLGFRVARRQKPIQKLAIRRVCDHPNIEKGPNVSEQIGVSRPDGHHDSPPAGF
jgi:hypothetical protein